MQVVINTQKALYAVLSSELEVDVYDHVQEDAGLPYVTIGNSSMVHSPVIGRSIYEMNFAIRAYDDNAGRKSLLELAEEIFEILNEKPLDIDDYSHQETRLISQSVQQTDESKYAFEANYRVVVS